MNLTSLMIQEPIRRLHQMMIILMIQEQIRMILELNQAILMTQAQIQEHQPIHLRQMMAERLERQLERLQVRQTLTIRHLQIKIKKVTREICRVTFLFHIIS
jgi:hypothetical protein